MEKIPLSVVVDNQTVEIENWMLVVALALKGVDWAVKLADDPEYNLRGKYKDYEKRKTRYLCKKSIDYHQREIERLLKAIEETLNE